jgi:2-keto-4-pentenoate hydratase/2-oxohepta-3-ene-1,7-dioic acid hydratase in catechol pathway
MKIICIGRNYLEHAKEMGKNITKDPIFFLKPDTSLISKKQPFFYQTLVKIFITRQS